MPTKTKRKAEFGIRKSSRSAFVFTLVELSVLIVLAAACPVGRAAGSPPLPNSTPQGDVSKNGNFSGPRAALREGEYKKLKANHEAAVATKAKADLSRSRNGALERMAANRLAEAKKTVAEGESQLNVIREDRLEIERRLEAAAAADFEYTDARRRYESRLTELSRHQQRLKASKKPLAGDASYQQALLEYQAADLVYGRRRLALFKADEGWRDNVQAARELKQVLKKAYDLVEVNTPQQLRASSQRRIAEKASAAADLTIEYSEWRGLKPIPTPTSKPKY